MLCAKDVGGETRNNRVPAKIAVKRFMREECRWVLGRLRGNKPRILLCALILFTSGSAGFIVYDLVRDRVPALMDYLFSNVFAEDELSTAINILARNISATTLMMLLGVLILPPIFVLALNGFLIGVVARYTNERGLSWLQILVGLTPHGVFEIPALIISASWGLKLGETLVNPGGGSRAAALKRVFREAAAVYVSVVLPLLIIAAFIEVLVSSKLVA
ncbi:MAG: hypothetical protein GF334_03780 [Candidatus Altiarchaeales archaeon]|nr:hypothetical protein [Candidatus Altiarchaeales archaeon]